MADILQAAGQTNNLPNQAPSGVPDPSQPADITSPIPAAAGMGSSIDSESNPPIEPPPVSPASSDSFIVPPIESPQGDIKSASNEPVKPKKKSRKGLLMAVLLLFLLTIPVVMYYVTSQTSIADLRNRATYNCTGGSVDQWCACANACVDHQALVACGLSCPNWCNNTNNCRGGGGGPTPTPGGGQCPGKACTSEADCSNCPGVNWVCVGTSPNRTCQQHGPDQCPGGGTCNGIIAFHCNSLTNGQCHDNAEDETSWSAGVSHAAGCGQVDQVCLGGTNNRNLCGNFEIIRSSCGGGGGPTATPGHGGPTNTPAPTTPAGPQCSRLKVYKDGTQVTDLTTLKAGDDVVIAIAGTGATKGRLRVNGGTFTETTTKNAQNEYTMPWTVPTGTTSFVIEGEVFGNGQWK